MKVVVTGAAGRLGKFVIQELAGYGHEPVGLDTTEPAKKNCPWLCINLRETNSLIRALQGFDAVIHLARVRFLYTANGFDSATGQWKYPDIAGDAERFSHNVTITYNLLAAAVE